jgi:hypothetical protein
MASHDPDGADGHEPDVERLLDDDDQMSSLGHAGEQREVGPRIDAPGWKMRPTRVLSAA